MSEMNDAVANILKGVESRSPFAEDAQEEEIEQEEAESTEEEESEETSETEETNEDEPKEGESDDEGEPEEEEESDDSKTVPLKALHAERTKRQELKKRLDEVQAQLTSLENTPDASSQALESVLKQLEDLDLLDVVKVEKPAEESDEVKQMRLDKQRQDQQKQFVETQNEIVSTVTDLLPEYPNLDKTDDEQGHVLMSMILTDMLFGGTDVEEASANAMKELNGIVAKLKKSASRQTVPPGKKIPKSSGRSKSKNKGPVRGSDEFFKNLAGSMTGD